jgi:hypothetical protein
MITNTRTTAIVIYVVVFIRDLLFLTHENAIGKTAHLFTALIYTQYASPLSSYHRYSPAASIEWGISLSAIWGRHNKAGRVAFCFGECHILLLAYISDTCMIVVEMGGARGRVSGRVPFSGTKHV